MKLLSMAFVAVLVAGCASPDPAATVPTGETETPRVTPTEMAETAETPATVERVEIPLSFSGSYPTAAYACHATVSCRGVEAGPYQNQITVGALEGNITDVELTMTWTATSPPMEELGMAIMVMYDDCEACESVEFATTTGASPLTLKVEAISIPIDPRGVLHAYFFPLNTVDGPVPVEVDTETRVEIEGRATLLKTA